MVFTKFFSLHNFISSVKTTSISKWKLKTYIDAMYISSRKLKVVAIALLLKLAPIIWHFRLKTSKMEILVLSVLRLSVMQPIKRNSGRPWWYSFWNFIAPLSLRFPISIITWFTWSHTHTGWRHWHVKLWSFTICARTQALWWRWLFKGMGWYLFFAGWCVGSYDMFLINNLLS